MDRFAAMLALLSMLVALVLVVLALFAIMPIVTSCLFALLYILYMFIANEDNGVHHAQEFENRFWTVFIMLFSTVIIFLNESPFAFGLWSPSFGFLAVLASGYAMHAWDRYVHRQEMSRDHGMLNPLRRGGSAMASLNRLQDLATGMAGGSGGMKVEDQLKRVNLALADIDQVFIPSTFNNYFNRCNVISRERDIISIFEEAEPRTLNYLISHVKLGLIFYKVKDHRDTYGGQSRTELIELLAVNRVSVLTVLSKVLVLSALQMLKLSANARAEYWARNIILRTYQDDLSELKSFMDSKGDYFSMNRLVFDDIRQPTIMHDILTHIKKQSDVQRAHMRMKTKKSKLRATKAWRKVLSDVDDTLTSSGGSYPAGIDKRFTKKVVYPGVLSFYRELDLGTVGPEEFPANSAGNLVFLSARPHIYKDVSEKHNFAKFQKMRSRGIMHATPSLLAGDVVSGGKFMLGNDMEPLAIKKFQNFQRYVSLYPEFQHVFICDNGQGDVRASEMMFDKYPNNLEHVYVHIVQGLKKCHGYDPIRWERKKFKPCFFRTYPDAAVHAATQKPPLIRMTGMRRVCFDAVRDFFLIEGKQWSSVQQKCNRRDELNQGLYRANQVLKLDGLQPVPLIPSDQLWKDGEKVHTPFGNATVSSFDPNFDIYEVEIDWRPLDVQVDEHKQNEVQRKSDATSMPNRIDAGSIVLETVVEIPETDEELVDGKNKKIPQEIEKLQNTSILSHDTHRGMASSKIARPTVNQRNKVDSRKSDETDSTCSISSSAHSPCNSLCPPVPDTVLISRGPTSTQRNDQTVRRKRAIRAKIHRRYISQYIPPSLPIISKESEIGRFSFSFWNENKDTSKNKMKQGDKCNTPYGSGTVLEERKASVVVDMEGWPGIAYLHQDNVQVSGEGILKNIIRQISLSDSSEQNVTTSKERSKRERNISCELGTVIQTPFGKGVISRPLVHYNLIGKGGTKNNSKASLVSKASNQAVEKSCDKMKNVELMDKTYPTVGISITSWILSDGSHPKVYCAPQIAEEWKNSNSSLEGSKSNILSVVGSLVSGMRRIVSPSPSEVKKSLSSSEIVLFERYYADGAPVTTSFGNGVVLSFRENDGFYEVLLIECKMKNSSFAKAFLRKDFLSYRLADGCHEGYPVLTSLGLSGVLASVDPMTGVHVVSVSSAPMVCYLQPKDLVCPLKAAVGDNVISPYGEGTVRKFRLHDNIYEVELHGWGGTLYAQGEMLDRVDDGIRDREGAFGVNWLLRFFFGSGKDDENQRSRSNSFASSTVRSQSGRSLSGRSLSGLSLGTT